MIKRRKLTTAISAALASGVLIAGMATVMAADKAATEPAKTMKADRDLDRASNDTMLTMRDLHEARVAIFNGDMDAARTHVDAARTRINSAVNEAETYATDVKKADQGDWYIPYDTSLAVVDTFQPENAKAAANDTKTGMHAKRNEQKNQQEQFRLNEQDIAVSAGLVPVKFAQEHITRASDLIAKGDYYQANLALKAVDDAVVIQTFAVDDNDTDATG